jgi:Bacterial Ig-like domain (group 3)/Autotransporter beta-domain
VSGSGGSPTGTVTIQFGDGTVVTGTLAAGVVVLNHTYAATGTFTVTATYSGSSTFTTSSVTTTQSVGAKASTTTLASSLNPSAPGQAVTFTATVTGASPTGTVQFKDGAANLGAPITLAAGTASFTTSTLTSGSHAITAVYSGDTNNLASTSAVLAQTVNGAATTTSLASSLNPSQAGQAVTFTASVASGSGTPAGTVTFKDGSTAIGSAALAGGVAALTTSALTVGSHSITAVYGGTAAFTTSTSAALVQAVSTPADSLKLRAMQVLAAPVVAQNSGAAISGAIDAAISEGFTDGGTFMTPSGSGVRFNFAADPDGKPADSTAPRPTDPFSSANGSLASTGHGFATPGSNNNSSRVDDAFSALAYAGPTKAPPPPPRYAEPRDWLAWAEVRGAVLDHWGSGTGAVGTVPGASMLYGSQVNFIAGLTRRLTPNFLVGVLGGYETFDYRSDALQGHLTGDGWTVGSYLGWKITQSIRFDAAVAYSGIGYDGTAGTASGNFGGDRLMISSGLTGNYRGFGLDIEPSARVYALWEHENAYTDSLGTAQAERDFSTGRASAGVKVAYPIAWSSTVALAPYLGLYGDYYFNSDNATAALAQSGLPGAVVLEGFSARAIGGVTAKFAGGGQIALGTEYSGIGGNASIWIYRARASVPF